MLRFVGTHTPLLHCAPGSYELALGWGLRDFTEADYPNPRRKKATEGKQAEGGVKAAGRQRTYSYVEEGRQYNVTVPERSGFPGVVKKLVIGLVLVCFVIGVNLLTAPFIQW